MVANLPKSYHSGVIFRNLKKEHCETLSESEQEIINDSEEFYEA